jgi:hypothetical protein
MKFINFLSLLIFTTVCGAAEQVEFLSDAIIQKNGNIIRLLGGSSWELTSLSFAIITDDIIIVFRNVPEREGQQIPIFYHDGMQIIARHIAGSYSKTSGLLANVIDKNGDGAVLELDDGRMLTIPDYDQFDTGWWLPPYPVIVTSDGLYMWNLDEGKRVWVNGIR